MAGFERRGRGGAGSRHPTGAARGAAIAVRIGLALGVGAWIGAGTGAAAPPSGDGGELSGCQDQARRLCQSVVDDEARTRCLLQRELECEDAGPSNITRKRVRDPATRLESACRDDFERVCAEVGHDALRSAILACLRAHEDAVSDACRVALALEAEGTPRPDFDACRVQIRKLCPGALGREPLRECLRTHGDALSAECRRVLARLAAGGDVPHPPHADPANP